MNIKKTKQVPPPRGPLVSLAQFGDMLRFSSRGWKPGPRGRRCPECGGAVWVKSFSRRREVHHCTSCAWGKEYHS